MFNDSIKYMSIRDFVDLGFLQEINRQLLHPAGLAMELHVPSDELTSQSVIRIWDYRDDPEGIIFAPGEISQEKISSVFNLIDSKRNYRRLLFEKSHIQDLQSRIVPKED